MVSMSYFTFFHSFFLSFLFSLLRAKSINIRYHRLNIVSENSWMNEWMNETWGSYRVNDAATIVNNINILVIGDFRISAKWQKICFQERKNLGEKWKSTNEKNANGIEKQSKLMFCVHVMHIINFILLYCINSIVWWWCWFKGNRIDGLNLNLMKFDFTWNIIRNYFFTVLTLCFSIIYFFSNKTNIFLFISTKWLIWINWVVCFDFYLFILSLFLLFQFLLLVQLVIVLIV